MTRRKRISLIATLVMLTAQACTTTSGFEQSETERMQASLKNGDVVRVVETDGSEYELRIEAVTANGLIGERPYLGRVEVPFADLEYVGIERIAPAKTAGAIVGGTVIAAVAGAILVAAALGGDITTD